MTDAKKKVEYIFDIFDWSCTLYANFEHLCAEWTLAGKNEKKTLKTDMNDWKVSFLYPQIVHDCTTALTTAHNTVATGIRIYWI